MIVPPAIYAHRLGGGYGPDSSRAALDHSLEGYVDGLETDCCLTADSELVLLHDPLLELGTRSQAGRISAPRRRSRTAGCATVTALPARSACCCSTSCSSSPARTRRCSSRTRHTPSCCSRSTPPVRSVTDSPPPRAGAQRDPQLPHQRVRTRRRPGVPNTRDRHNRSSLPGRAVPLPRPAIPTSWVSLTPGSYCPWRGGRLGASMERLRREIG